MNFLLPEKVLETQICSVCKQYLSYGPIKVYRKAGTQCGRCNTKTDEGTVSLGNSIVQNLRFPCVNRFEGCNGIIGFGNVPEHEKTCVGHQYQCPLCPEEKYVPNSLLYLINHYKIFHSRYFLRESSFFVDVSSPGEDFLLYCDKSENILLIVFVQVKGTKVCINASTVGTRVNKLKYKVKVYVDGTQKYVSEERTCSAVGLNFEQLEINSKEVLGTTTSTMLCVLELNMADILSISMSSTKLDEPVLKSVEELVEEYNRMVDREPLTAALLAAASPGKRKQMLRGRLSPLLPLIQSLKNAVERTVAELEAKRTST